MASLNMQFSPQGTGKDILVKINADQFERLAATFGFFNPEFLKSLQRAEKDIKQGRMRKLKSLKDLRN